MLVKLLTEFYYRSLKHNWDGFDFDGLFEELKEPIQYKLSEHGLLGYDEFVGSRENFYGDHAKLIPPELTAQSAYICFDEEDAARTILKALYRLHLDAFSNMFVDLREIYEALDCSPCSLSERIALVDRAVHAQHTGGDIFGDIDTERIKAEAEEMYECSLELA